MIPKGSKRLLPSNPWNVDSMRLEPPAKYQRLLYHSTTAEEESFAYSPTNPFVGSLENHESSTTHRTDDNMSEVGLHAFKSRGFAIVMEDELRHVHFIMSMYTAYNLAVPPAS